jgi:phage repressor protein C with HTH and peptisase S24 domain
MEPQKISRTLADLRRRSGLTQEQVREYLNGKCRKQNKPGAVSTWEIGTAAPSLEQFFALCDLYGVDDVRRTFMGSKRARLNGLGQSRLDEYAKMLASNPKFSDYAETTELAEPSEPKQASPCRVIPLYDTPVAAGTGVFLDGDSYEEYEAGDEAPADADFAVRVRGDSMAPQFEDGQIVFVRKQESLDAGKVGVFELNGNAYIKTLSNGELISLNDAYAPIRIGEYDSFRIFGEVLG